MPSSDCLVLPHSFTCQFMTYANEIDRIHTMPCICIPPASTPLNVSTFLVLQPGINMESIRIILYIINLHITHNIEVDRKIYIVFQIIYKYKM